jgi:hypothetical protein
MLAVSVRGRCGTTDHVLFLHSLAAEWQGPLDSVLNYPVSARAN